MCWDSEGWEIFLLFWSQGFSLREHLQSSKFTDLSDSLFISFWSVLFVVKPIQWIFHFKYYIFQSYEFIWFFLIVSVSLMRLSICSFIVSIFCLNSLTYLFPCSKMFWLLIPTFLSHLGLFLLTDLFFFFLFSNSLFLNIVDDTLFSLGFAIFPYKLLYSGFSSYHINLSPFTKDCRVLFWQVTIHWWISLILLRHDPPAATEWPETLTYVSSIQQEYHNLLGSTSFCLIWWAWGSSCVFPFSQGSHYCTELPSNV